jgi:hypothetical protein
MGLLCGRAGRLNTKNIGFRRLVPPPVWSTNDLLLQNFTSPRFTILNGGSPGQWLSGCGGLEERARQHWIIRWQV